MKPQLNRFLLAALGLILLLGSQAVARERWTPEQANDWYAKQPWPVGCNFSPSSAMNQLEMWQADTFDIKTIDRELGWAEQLGFNSIRVYLHNLLWEDREGFIGRIDRFLEVADSHGIGVMFVPLDGVWDPQPKLGKQHEPRPHVHNSGWVQAPGAAILGDPSRHDELRPYIYGLIHHYRDDRRILAWDLFNEPDNPNVNSYGTEGTKTELPNKAEMATLLLKKVFHWAREAEPSQPLTAAVWVGPWPNDEDLAPHERVMLHESDIITFHNYNDLSQLRPRVEQLRRYNRPILCSEYMARGNASRFDPLLAYFKQEKVGAFNWGFVAGRSQTIYPWDTWQKTYTSEPELWFHDIFRKDGTPYDQREVDYIRRTTGATQPSEPSANTYRNPIIEQIGPADPAVIRYKGLYYLYPTWDSRSYDVFVSKDLIHWEQQPEKCYVDRRGGVWAPDVFYNDKGDGKFYLYYTADSRRPNDPRRQKLIGVAVADDPLGPFVDKGVLAEGSIDAHLFRDDDGRLYLYYVELNPGPFKILAQEMSDPLTKQGEPKEVIRPTEPWEMARGQVTEGPWMLKRDGTYYLMYSGSGANGPEYAIGYATSKSPMGPFKKYENNPIAKQGNGVFGPGHHCVVEGPNGKLWMVYHQQNSEEPGWKRFLAIDPLWFDENGVIHAKVSRGTDEPGP
ncbi:MAG TPA: family 43 glycosylhydrolase [Thermoguttaceae bacterium]|nr:family 43 glycosylhydrolase [Thermoguttaceae bacterium]